MAGPEPDLWNVYGYRTALAEWASVVALFVSGYAALAIRSVRSRILSKVRLPELEGQLEAVATEIATLMREYDTNRDQVGLALSRCQAHLTVLQTSVTGNTKATVRKLLAEIRKYKGYKTVLFDND